MSSRQQVLEAVEESYRYSSPHGVSCYFVPLDDNWGVKVYESASKRDENICMQARAAEHGLGPEVGESFDLPDGQYCYVTERAELLDFVNEDDAHFNYEDDEAWQHENWDEINELTTALQREIGFRFYDVHAANFGYIEGRLVCIDFGYD
jgi:hypothetical protein